MQMFHYVSYREHGPRKLLVQEERKLGGRAVAEVTASTVLQIERASKIDCAAFLKMTQLVAQRRQSRFLGRFGEQA